MVVEQISIWGFITGIGLIVAIIANIYGIVNQNKKNKEKYATKEYVKQEHKAMDIRMSSIEKDIADNEKHNQREHDAILNSLTRMEDKIDRLLEKSA